MVMASTPLSGRKASPGQKVNVAGGKRKLWFPNIFLNFMKKKLMGKIKSHQTPESPFLSFFVQSHQDVDVEDHLFITEHFFCKNVTACISQSDGISCAFGASAVASSKQVKPIRIQPTYSVINIKLHVFGVLENCTFTYVANTSVKALHRQIPMQIDQWASIFKCAASQQKKTHLQPDKNKASLLQLNYPPTVTAIQILNDPEITLDRNSGIKQPTVFLICFLSVTVYYSYSFSC